MSFDQFGLPAALAANLARMQYTTPTPIQEQAIPFAMQGRDVLGTAQTGTGKTAAFAIPMIAKLMTSPRGMALIMTPTRELASQVMEVITQLLGQRSFIPTALLIGGDAMNPQIAKLRTRPRIIVGTPGRINDHLERGNLILHEAGFLVLDETDRMLDMGFGPQIDKIVRFLPQQRQTLLFSATLPNEILRMAARYQHNPERIAVGSTNKPMATIEQEILPVADADKFETLVSQLSARQGSIIVFVKSRRGADRLSEKLTRRKLSADSIHGDLHQRQRERVIQGFRDKKFRILVATDIAARGLDIPHIEHVVNYDLPQNPEDYIHRIGRTARNGAEGAALCLLAPADYEKWEAVHKMLHPGQPVPHLPKREHRSHGHGGGHGHPRPPHGDRKPSRRRRFRGGRPGGGASPAA